MNICILYSAGLDSRILLQYAKVKYPDAKVSCVYYAHGAESEAEELRLLPDFVTVRKIDWLNETCRPVSKLEDPMAGAIYIPGRNLIFASLAACQEMAEEVWMGTLWDEDNPKGTDKNEKFRDDSSALLSYVLSPFLPGVRVRFPFVEEGWCKYDSVKWALENGLSQQDLKDTVSCWHFIDMPCGECKQCFKRNLVFTLNGFSEAYRRDPTNEDLQALYVKAVLEDGSDNRDELNVTKMISKRKMELHKEDKAMRSFFEGFLHLVEKKLGALASK